MDGTTDGTTGRGRQAFGELRERTPRADGEGGFALLVALLALVGVTVLAAAGFMNATSDYRINQNHRAGTTAFYLADATLAQQLGSGKVSLDTTSHTYADGSGDVWMRPLIMVDDSSTLYQVTASGRHDPPEGGTSGREVHTVVIHKAAGFAMNAAITAPGGLQKNGVAGTVSGYDAAAPGSCPVAGSANLAGLRVPPGGYSQSGAGPGGGPVPVGFVGNPGIDSTQAATQLLADTGIDWAGLLDGSFAEADYVVSEDGFPDFSSDVGPDEWPLIYVDSDSYSLNPTQSGRGTLVVRGDLEFNGAVEWDGIVLVGNNLTSNGTQIVEGSVVTGLNMLLGQSVDESSLGNGTWLYSYHSCNVLNALKGIGTPVEEPGAWFERI